MARGWREHTKCPWEISYAFPVPFPPQSPLQHPPYSYPHADNSHLQSLRVYVPVCLRFIYTTHVCC